MSVEESRCQPSSEVLLDNVPCDFKRRAPERLTVTLAQEALLRATPFSTLLAGFGQVLRATDGGIGLQGETDGEDDRSLPVKEIDIFFSHSWHAPWFSKYLILLFHFNGQPAVFTAFAISLLIYMVRAQYTDLPLSPLSEDCWLAPNRTNFYEIPIVGTLIFVFMLLTWQDIACVCLKHLPFCKLVFLDKVCINQTDPVRKEAGIKSIGAFVYKSKSVLVAWDPTYFDRLWCTFELSAFFHVRPQGALIVLPCAIGAAIFVHYILFALQTYWKMVLMMQGGFQTENTFFNRIVVQGLVCFPTTFFTMMILRNYLWQVGHLEDNLKQFHVRTSKCFCCSVDHVLPHNGTRIPCDREVVYASIAEWYGNGSLERGLTHFDAKVRGGLHMSIRKTLGSIHFSYTHAIILGLPASLHAMTACCSCPLWIQMLRISSFLFLRAPIWAVLLVHTAKLFQRRQTTFVLDIGASCAATLCGNFVFFLFEFARDIYWIRARVLAIMVWYTCETLFVFRIWYLGRYYDDRIDVSNKSTQEPPIVSVELATVPTTNSLHL